MKRASIRSGLAAAGALVLALAFASPGGAQSTQEVTVSYAAQADTSALEINLADGGLELSAAITHSEVSSAGPGASGFGQVFNQSADTRAETDAPPDGNASATAAAQSGSTPGDVLDYDIGAGEADSESEAEDGTPSTANAATVGDITIDNGSTLNSVLPQISVSITALTSSSSAKANNAPSASSAATATGAIIDVQVDAEALTTAVCDALGDIPVIGGDLETQCETLQQEVGLQDFLSATIADGEVECSWSDLKPAADGAAQLIALTVLGEEVPIDIGEQQTIAGGTPLESTIGAGAFSKQVEDGGVGDEDSASARASGAFVELFGQQIVLAFGDATCGVTGQVVSDEVIARTGGEVFPVLFGGAALVGVGAGIRRFLKR